MSKDVLAYARLMGIIAASEAQEEVAYRVHFVAGVVQAVLRLATGVAGLAVLFTRVERIHGWDFPATLALLGTYLTLDALRELVIAPSLDALAGEEGDVRSGQFDYTLLRPVDAQFLSSVKRWSVLSLLDLALGLGVVLVATLQLEHRLTLLDVLAFALAMVAGVAALYAVVLAGAALVFWVPEIFFTWVIDSLFQLGHYPVDLYPGGLRLVLTWIVPVGVMTTVPAQALTGAASWHVLIGALVLAAAMVTASSALFRVGLRRYTSASS
jgi:ABC-2 type transport system permease protein